MRATQAVSRDSFWRGQLVLTKRMECTINRIFLIPVLKDPISATKAVLATLLKEICKIITVVQQRRQVTYNYLLPEKNLATAHGCKEAFKEPDCCTKIQQWI